MEHPLGDVLWLRMVQHLCDGTVEGVELERWQTCPDCGADRRAIEGSWREEKNRPQAVHAGRLIAAMHVGIDRATGTAAESILYTVEAVSPEPEGATFEGWVYLTASAHELLMELLDAIDGIVYIGHHRTRGYGETHLSLEQTPVETDAEAERWQAWSRGFLEFAQELGQSAAPATAERLRSLDPEHDFFFALSFPNGAVLVDELLRYTLDPAAVEEMLSPMPPSGRWFPLKNRPARTIDSQATLRCVAAITRHELLRGWNAAHGLPRQDEWMVDRGAVYAYWLRGPQTSRQSYLQTLRRLQSEGIGLRRAEGYGVVDVSDPYHMMCH